MLLGEPDRAVPFGRGVEDGEQEPDLGPWVARTPSGPAEEVADDDRWRVGAADHFDEMTEGVGDRRIGDHLRVFAQFLHLDLEAPIRRHDDLMTARPVVHHPSVPTSSGHPAPVVQHDR